MIDNLKELFYSGNYELFWELYKSQNVTDFVLDFNRIPYFEDYSFWEYQLNDLFVICIYSDRHNLTAYNSKIKNGRAISYEVDIAYNDKWLDYKGIENTLDLLKLPELKQFIIKEDGYGAHLGFITHEDLTKLIIAIFKYNDRNKEDI